MKICIISPTSHVQAFSTHGDADMVLTHIVLGLTDVVTGTNTPSHDQGDHSSFKDNYIEYYRHRAQNGFFTILDNSAYEIGRLEAQSASGQGLGPELVLQAARIIKPSIVICQDILCDSEATTEATRDFIEFVKKSGEFGNFKLMAVPQGKDEASWLRSYKTLSEMPEIDMLGFSKISIPISFGGNQATPGCVTDARLKCTSIVEQEFRYKKDVHLLGGDNHLGRELSKQKYYDWIFSNDSSAAVWYGMHGKEFDSLGTTPEIITTKPDLENLDPQTEKKLQRHRANILHNIAVLQRLTKD
jgi:hypothetical protein